MQRHKIFKRQIRSLDPIKHKFNSVVFGQFQLFFRFAFLVFTRIIPQLGNFSRGAQHSSGFFMRGASFLGDFHLLLFSRIIIWGIFLAVFLPFYYLGNLLPHLGIIWGNNVRLMFISVTVFLFRLYLSVSYSLGVYFLASFIIWGVLLLYYPPPRPGGVVTPISHRVEICQNPVPHR